MNKNGRRFAAKERIEHKGSKILSVGNGKKWSINRVNVGKCGQRVEKWTGFSRLETTSTRLFPYKSTQVVDFPHLSRVSVFSGEQLTAETQRHRAKRSLEPVWESQKNGQSLCRLAGKQHEHGKWSIGGRLEEGFGEKWLCSITRIYTHLPPFITCSQAVTLRALRPSVWRVR
jgi:hypothetical protein